MVGIFETHFSIYTYDGILIVAPIYIACTKHSLIEIGKWQENCVLSIQNRLKVRSHQPKIASINGS